LAFYRKNIAFLFLLLLVGISLPKAWVHQCKQSIEVNSDLADHNEDSHQEQSHCDVCDFEFGTLQVTTFEPLFGSANLLTTFYKNILVETELANAVILLNKAPPVLPLFQV
jgi:hypothetical protein